MRTAGAERSNPSMPAIRWTRKIPVRRLALSHLLVAALFALGAVGACKGREQSLGANCLTPRQGCEGKHCGDPCRCCSTGSVTTPDIDGFCGGDGVCAATAPSCGPSSSGVDSGAGGQVDAGGSAGCGKAGAATGLLAGQTITVAGQARTYVLSVPTDYSGTAPLALVLAWHGANLNGTLAQKLFNLESKSGGAAIFAYPDGVAAAGWNLSAGSADFQLFLALVDSISSSYCIDANRLFATGHSSGAVMANDLGCYYGDKLRAIAPASGTPPSLAGRTGCTGKVAAMIMHGENDSTFSQGEATRDFWIKQDGCDAQTATWAPEPACIEYRGCQPDLPVLWCVHDGAHAWPSLSFGCDADGGICFDGGSAIWAFFSSFR
jgi:polyhydroxybutyrate depolymerase